MLSGMIYDRTAADVAAKNAKGTYNASDLNRVGAAILSVSARLCADGYAAEVTQRADFAASDDLRYGELQRMIDNVKKLRGCFAVFSDTPEAPEGIRFFDYGKANDVEKILFDVDALTDNIEAAQVYCGELYSGEV